MNFSDQECYIDIHTHSAANAADVIQIINLFPEQPVSPLAALSFYSIGWHPWYLSEEHYSAYLNIVSTQSQHQEVLAIGECGLDQLSTVPLSFQIEVFRQQILISEAVEKPLLIHCVRASNEIIKLKKELKPKMPWIIHGYNSNLVTGREMLRHGFYISFGMDLLKDISNAINFLPELPLDHLFLETGDKDISIEKIYRQAALILNIDLLILKKQVQQNFNRLFT